MIKDVNTENLSAAIVAASATDYLVNVRFDLIQQGEQARAEMRKAGRLLKVNREIIMEAAQLGIFEGLADKLGLYENARAMMRTAAKRFAAFEKARKYVENVPWPYTGDTAADVRKAVEKIVNP